MAGRAIDDEGFRSRFDRALQLRDEGDLVGSIDLLAALSAEAPEYGPVFMMLGSVLKNAGRFGEAAAAFRRAVQLGPKSRLSSLGLFHSLYDAGRRWEAFAEIKRRLDIKPLDDYIEFLNSMSQEDLDLLGERGLLPTGWRRRSAP